MISRQTLPVKLRLGRKHTPIAIPHPPSSAMDVDDPLTEVGETTSLGNHVQITMERSTSTCTDITVSDTPPTPCGSDKIVAADPPQGRGFHSIMGHS